MSKYNKLDHKYVDHDFCITSSFYQPLFFEILNNLKENMAFRTSHATWFLVFCVLNVITDAFFFVEKTFDYN